MSVSIAIEGSAPLSTPATDHASLVVPSNRTRGADAPSTRELLAMAAAAAGIRIVCFLIVWLALGVPVERYGLKGDGESYLTRGAALAGDEVKVLEADTRVFPGYPVLIGMVRRATGMPIVWAALTVEWIAVALVAVTSGMLFADRRIGWACALLTPHYIVNSSLVMSEAPLLAATVFGLVASRRGRPVLAGLLLGYAGLIRPMACFAVAGAIAAEFHAGRRKAALLSGGVSAAVVLGGIVALHLTTGDALGGIRVYQTHTGAYGGQMIVWPFKSLIFTPRYYEVSVGRIVYIWAHVALVFAGIGVLAARCLRAGRQSGWIDVLCVVWLAGNTMFVLCIGNLWGFQHFPRFIIPAMPALFWAWRGALRLPWYAWGAIGLLEIPNGVFGVHGTP